MATQTYSNRSNARRAAKAAGLDLSTLEFYEVGFGWSWKQTASAAPKAPRYKLHRRKAKPVQAPAPVAPVQAPAAQPAAQPASGTPKHKEFSVYSKSAVLSPVAYVREFLTANGAGMTRKEALYALAQAGVNYATARTQYQRWFSSRAK